MLTIEFQVTLTYKITYFREIPETLSKQDQKPLRATMTPKHLSVSFS